MSKNEALRTSKAIRKIRKSLEFHRSRAAELELELERLAPFSPAESPGIQARAYPEENSKIRGAEGKEASPFRRLGRAEDGPSLPDGRQKKRASAPEEGRNPELEEHRGHSPPREDEREKRPLPASGAGPAKRILVVDDDPTTINIITHFLEKEDYAVSSSRSGVEGLKRVFKEKPDLILLDILMPDLNGFQFLSILTKDEESARIPVVIISSLAEEADVLRGLRIGAADFVTKPFSPQVLITKVRKNLDSRP